MYDATGRLVLTEQNQAAEGDNQITLHVGNILPVGLYIVEVQQGEQIEKSRVIIAE
jgi:cell shape-determining protein MreC